MEVKIDTIQNFFIGYLSIQRNVYLLFSLGLALITFAHNIKDSLFLKYISYFLFLFSLSYGLLNNLYHYNNLNYINNNFKLNKFQNKQMLNFKIWIYFHLLFSLFTLIVVGYLLMR